MCGLAGFGILLAVGFLGFNVNFRKQRYGIKWSMCLEKVIEYVSNFSVDFFGKSREEYMCCMVLPSSGLKGILEGSQQMPIQGETVQKD